MIFSDAETLHVNFYHDFLDAETIIRRIKDAEIFIGKMEALVINQVGLK